MSATAPLKPIMRYPGGKARIANWIVANLPEHWCYVEPFFGGGSVLFAKPRVSIEVANDLDDRVMNLYRVIRESPDELARIVALTPYSHAEYDLSDELTGDPIENARRFLVRVWMAHAGRLGGSRPGWRCGMAGSIGGDRGAVSKVWAGVPDRILAVVERLHGVMFECRPALEVIAYWKRDDALIFADPPYLWETRNAPGSKGRHYAFEMTDQDHIDLLAALQGHPGPVVLCGYRSELYDDTLANWRRVDRDTTAYRNGQRTESLWLNPVAAATARQQPMDFGGAA